MQNFDRRNIDELDKYLVIYQNFTIHKFSLGAYCIYPIQQNSNFPDPYVYGNLYEESCIDMWCLNMHNCLMTTHILSNIFEDMRCIT